jgi:hypothetical protein
MRKGWCFRLVFSIHLHKKDINVLHLIQKYFSVGNVTLHKDTINFQVVSMGDLLKIIDHFDKYPLKTQKYSDFLLFKKAYGLILNKEHLTEQGLQKLINIRASMNKGLPERLLLEFPNTNPEIRSILSLDKNDKLFDMNN